MCLIFEGNERESEFYKFLNGCPECPGALYTMRRHRFVVFENNIILAAYEQGVRTAHMLATGSATGEMSADVCVPLQLQSIRHKKFLFTPVSVLLSLNCLGQAWKRRLEIEGVRCRRR